MELKFLLLIFVLEVPEYHSSKCENLKTINCNNTLKNLLTTAHHKWILLRTRLASIKSLWALSLFSPSTLISCILFKRPFICFDFLSNCVLTEQQAQTVFATNCVYTFCWEGWIGPPQTVHLQWTYTQSTQPYQNTKQDRIVRYILKHNAILHICIWLTNAKKIGTNLELPIIYYFWVVKHLFSEI